MSKLIILNGTSISINVSSLVQLFIIMPFIYHIILESVFFDKIILASVFIVERYLLTLLGTSIKSTCNKDKLWVCLVHLLSLFQCFSKQTRPQPTTPRKEF